MIDLINRRASAWGLIALALILCAVSNLPWNLDEYDQAKQAFTSFEMVTEGHWIYQHTPNGLVATKPPLIGWVSAGLFAAIQSWPLAWRLPSFFATLVLLGLLVRASAVYGSIAALVAACAFSFNLITPRLATLVRTDMPLALILFVICWLIWKKIRTRQPWQTRDRFWIFVLLTAGLLIKGPIIYAFLLPAVLAFMWRARAKRETLTVWFGWWPWLASFAVFVLWVGGGILFVPGFFEQVVMREFAGRFGGSVHRSQPFYFYLLHLLHRYAPWSILLMLFPFFAVKEARFNIRAQLRTIAPETFWLLAFSFGGLLVMSLVPSKRIDRVFPIVPPLCLLLAVQIGQLRETEKVKRLMETCCSYAIAIAFLFTASYEVGKMVLAYGHNSNAFVKFGHAVRQEATAHGWRYKVVGGKDEGMLLYLRQTQFIEPDQAVAEWNSGKLDGLVVPSDQLPGLLPHLPGATLSGIGESGPAGRDQRRYTFLVRASVIAIASAPKAARLCAAGS